MWPSPETVGGLKKQTDAATETFYKLQANTGTDITNAFLASSATKAMIARATTALDSLELEAHKSFCNCINDPQMKDLAIQFQALNKQTSEALENSKAHPTALDAKEKYNELSKQTTEAYAALIAQSPAARNAAKTVQRTLEQADSLCRSHPVLCRLIATKLVTAIFPGAILLPIGFDTQGQWKGSLAASVQSTVYGPTVPRGSPFSVLQSWGMKGVPGEARAAMVGGPIAALLLTQMKRDWTPEGCKELAKGAGRTAKL